MAMGAPLGNQNGCTMTDPKVRQKAYKSFCDHLAKGKAIKSWFYKDEDGNRCIWATMLSYIEKNPLEFDPITKDLAIAEGYQRWEKVVEDSADGKNKKANTASLQMLMRNKFGWDKEDKSKAPDALTLTPEQFNQLINARSSQVSE